MKRVRVTRVLVMEGPEEWVKKTMKHRVVTGLDSRIIASGSIIEKSVVYETLKEREEVRISIKGIEPVDSIGE